MQREHVNCILLDKNERGLFLNFSLFRIGKVKRKRENSPSGMSTAVLNGVPLSYTTTVRLTEALLFNIFFIKD